MRAIISVFFLINILLNSCAQIKHTENHKGNREVKFTTSYPEKNSGRVASSLSKGMSKVDRIDTLDKDGAWCWFADPRALYYRGKKEQTYFSWVTSTGDIVFVIFNF